MSNYPVISIIVPAYNAMDTIERTLNSLTDNNYDIEIICVDDGSSDKTADIINYQISKDNRIKIIRQENRGVSAARNTGLMNIRGRFVMFCDADDEYDTEVLKCVFEDVSKYNPDYIIFGRTSIYGVNKEYDWLVNKNECIILDCDWIEYFNKIIYTRGHSNVVCNRVFKSQIINENKLFFNENLTLGEDLYFNFLYIMHCRCIIEDGRGRNIQHKQKDSLTTRRRSDYFAKDTLVLQYIKNDTAWSEKLYPFYDRHLLNTVILAVNRLLNGRDATTNHEKKEIINKILNNPEFHDAYDRFINSEYIFKHTSVSPKLKLIKHKMILLYWVRYIFLPKVKEKHNLKKRRHEKTGSNL